MNNQMLMYMMIGVGALFAIIVIVFFILKRNNKEEKYIRKIQQGTKTSAFSKEIIYKNLYVF